jgi:hypothetical protein
MRNASVNPVTFIVFTAGDQVSFAGMNETEQTEGGVPTQNRATTGGLVAWTNVIPNSHVLISLSDRLPTVGSPPLSGMSYLASGMRRANAKYVHTERIQDARAKQEMPHKR